MQLRAVLPALLLSLFSPGGGISSGISGEISEGISGGSPAKAPDAPQHELEVAFPNLHFTRPLALVDPRDGAGRLYVVEQRGRIYAFENRPDVKEARLFLDISGRVNSKGNEEGLLGLAFHPRFRENHLFYVNYTAYPPRRSIIARFTALTSGPVRGDPSSEVQLLTYAQPYENHNGGQLAFGPDSMLYIGVGDGGSAGDPHRNGQNLSALLGKILRIDVDHPDPGMQYGIPKDNPFTGGLRRGEIWAYGLRNPWRFSFDRATGRLWAGDVGQDQIEEIDTIARGRNYGWNIMEGSACFKPAQGCDTAGLTRPVAEYHHDVGVCVIGGFVYRGTRLPDLSGAYIYADYGSGRIWALRLGGPGVSGNASNVELMHSGMPITSFGEDAANELYLCVFDGQIYRIR
jgi:glucose/arabinose dehydrogenase